MVTGDSGRTAAAIGRRIGPLEGDVHVITGPELAVLDDGELRRRLRERHVIFARIDPEQKLRLGPWETLTDSGTLHREATTMTMAGIVMAQVGAGLAWRTNRLSLRDVGLWSNRLLLAGIGVEVAMIARLAYTPGLNDVFHTSALGLWNWLFLLAWPPVVLGADEAHKALARRAEPHGRPPPGARGA